MKQKLEATNEDAKALKVLRTENKEIRSRLSEVVQQNFVLSEHLENMQRCIEEKENDNKELWKKVESMEMNSLLNLSRELTPFQQPLINLNCTIPQAQPERNNSASTPTPISLSEEIDQLSPPKRKPSSTEKNQDDAFEDYIHLAAAAVKISFPDVLVSKTDLIKKARKVPFWRVHDVLSMFMMRK